MGRKKKMKGREPSGNGWKVSLTDGSEEKIPRGKAPNPRMAVAIALEKHGGYPSVKVSSVEWGWI